MTFDEYIFNPMTKAGAVFSAAIRESMRTVYTTKFNNILLRENGNIKYKMYKDTKNNAYIIHIKIPSEVVKNFYYDVVLKFFTDAKVKDAGRSLNKYQVNFFSNDPAFVFTYAHSFISNKIFFRDLLPRMTQEAIKKKAVVKNPTDMVGYVKSLYFAYLFMESRGLFKTVLWNGCLDYDKNLLLQRVMSADQKIDDREREGKKVGNKKKVQMDLDTYKKISRYNLSDEAKSNIAITKTTPTNKVIKNVKTSKVIKPKSKSSTIK